MNLSRSLAALVAFSHRRALPVLLLGLLLAALGGWYASGHLGVSTDTDQMFSGTLPWKQRETALKRDFPQFQDLIVVVIDGKEPEIADATAAELAATLGADKTHFDRVSRPDASPFLAREAFLFLDTKQLEPLLNSTIDAQPFLGQLVADPSARGLFTSLALLGIGVQQGQADLGPYAATLKAFHEAMAGALDGHPHPLSWQRLLGGNLSDLAGEYRFVLVHPKLDYGALQPGGAATAAVRAAAAGIDFVRSGDARVRITGSVVLADEEFATVAHGAAAGLLASLLLITLWLYLALKSWRLIVPALLTLLLGLLLTLSFAAAAIGTLNLVSVGFGILFVGIAVDFAIQFSVRFREYRLTAPDIGAALVETGRRSGAQILVAAAATAAGFLAFVPTDFAGVAELGLIAGVGMLIAFLCTLVFLPAVATLFRPRGEAAEVGFRWAAPLDPVVRRRRAPILFVSGLLAVLGVALLPRLVFDPDPLHTKDPTTEAMRTLYDLMDSPVTNPFTIDVIAPDAAQAEAMAAKLAKLPLVAQTLSIGSFVPGDQQAKLALIADASSILSATLAPHAPAAPVTPGEVRLAASTALEQIKPALAKLPPGHPLMALAADLQKVTTAPDAIVAGLDAALTRFLPAELDALRSALAAEPVTLDSIPPEIKRDWMLPDGRARVQAVPKREALTHGGLRDFVAEVRGVAPDAGGSAVTIVATSETIVGSFRTAALSALVAIAVILFLALRRPLDVGLVLAPLLLSGLLTVVVMALAPLPLNYANIIALPLLLGVGVSFNIYFVMNWRAGQKAVLGSATARAILFSALTTGTAFGSLALSPHPGTASMGRLLLISLACTLLASLVFIPALLAAVPAPKER
jgi:hopanoid biosynthesis associated RND transporter like protein HpnN